MEFQDTKAITMIYNEYVEHSVATFETEPLREEDMRNRIAVFFPYFVYGEEGKIVGYCYAHLWKERAAYRHTLETTVYLAPGYEGKGIGRELMERLIEECCRDGYRALIACVTEGNAASDALHFSEQDVYRVLVDRLWPRGMKREYLKYDYWVKEITPSNDLRKWFHADVEKNGGLLRLCIKKN